VPSTTGVFVNALQPGGNLAGPLWEPSVQVRLALTGTGSLGGISVSGRWSGAFNGTVSGTTNPTGKVTLTADAISEDTLTFTILSVSSGDYDYRPGLNVVNQVTVTRADAN
jgi:hypothetical protein